MRRREFLTMTGAVAAGLMLPARPALAMMDLGGGASLTTLSDGHLVLPADFAFGTFPADEVAPIREAFGLTGDRVEPGCNLALYRDGTNTVLFDAGSGPDFMPTAGKLAEALDAAGLSVEDITHVVFTHAHPDHIWGLLDDFDEPLFLNATHMMGRAEWDYWWNPETVNTIGGARATFAVGAKRRMEVIEDSVEFFDDGQEILPGIAAVASYGHTPGHMAFEVRPAGQSALIVGDAIGNHHVALRQPGWQSASDQDPETGVTTRLRLLDRLTSEQMALVGFHLPGGGMGRVMRDGDAFRFEEGA